MSNSPIKQFTSTSIYKKITAFYEQILYITILHANQLMHGAEFSASRKLSLHEQD